MGVRMGNGLVSLLFWEVKEAMLNLEVMTNWRNQNRPRLLLLVALVKLELSPREKRVLSPRPGGEDTLPRWRKLISHPSLLSDNSRTIRDFQLYVSAMSLPAVSLEDWLCDVCVSRKGGTGGSMLVLPECEDTQTNKQTNSCGKCETILWPARRPRTPFQKFARSWPCVICNIVPWWLLPICWTVHSLTVASNQLCDA